MFSYFGSKSSTSEYYSKPKYDTIIEPFAGSAQYAFHYWDKKVILIEKNKTIYDIWDWLINRATKKLILSLPIFEAKQRIIYSDPIIRNFIALESNPGTIKPRNYPSWGWRIYRRKSLADNLHKIKHWKIIHGDYSLAPDIKATWFIDPPYSFRQTDTNDGYGNEPIDYLILGDWCRSRKGQTIVCEELLADWLPFEFLGAPISLTRSNMKSIEAFWENENV